LTPAALGAIGAGGIGQVEVDGTDVLWTEARPADGGRTTLVRRAPDGTAADLLPAPFDVGSRVHEYGGRSFAAADGTVWFSHRGDDRVYRLAPGDGEPRAVTAAGGPRLADFCADRARGLLFAVAEDHREPGEARNYLVTVSTVSGTITEITGGYDFYGAPRLSPDGSLLAAPGHALGRDRTLGRRRRRRRHPVRGVADRRRPRRIRRVAALVASG
jgi:outer membrane protein assembly factor BamB